MRKRILIPSLLLSAGVAMAVWPVSAFAQGLPATIPARDTPKHDLDPRSDLVPPDAPAEPPREWPKDLPREGARDGVRESTSAPADHRAEPPVRLAGGGRGQDQGGPGEAEGAESKGPTDRSRIAAAKEDAIARLREQIHHEAITRELTVGELLRKSHATSQLDQLLASGDLIGGPRWIDHQTCQVQLEVAGERVAQLLQDVTRAHPEAPADPAAVRDLGAAWRRRTFSATGTSTTAFDALAGNAGRDLPDSWRSVPEADLQRAVEDARRDAARGVIASISTIVIPPAERGQTVADALRDPKLNQAVREWLAGRPIVRVRYRDDLRAEVQLGVSWREVYQFVRTLLEGRPGLEALSGAAAQATFREAFETHMVSANGRSVPVRAADDEARPARPRTVRRVADPPDTDHSATPPGDQGTEHATEHGGDHVGDHSTDPPVGPGPRNVVGPRVAVFPPRAAAAPLRAPEWAFDRLDSTVTMTPTARGVPLLTLRQRAVAEARGRLLARVEELRLGGLALGAVARRDERAARALSRALSTARVERTEYRADGGVTVRMSMDLREVWDNLRDVGMIAR